MLCWALLRRFSLSCFYLQLLAHWPRYKSPQSKWETRRNNKTSTARYKRQNGTHFVLCNWTKIYCLMAFITVLPTRDFLPINRRRRRFVFFFRFVRLSFLYTILLLFEHKPPRWFVWVRAKAFFGNQPPHRLAHSGHLTSSAVPAPSTLPNHPLASFEVTNTQIHTKKKYDKRII